MSPPQCYLLTCPQTHLLHWSKLAYLIFKSLRLVDLKSSFFLKSPCQRNLNRGICHTPNFDQSPRLLLIFTRVVICIFYPHFIFILSIFVHLKPKTHVTHAVKLFSNHPLILILFHICYPRYLFLTLIAF